MINIKKFTEEFEHHKSSNPKLQKLIDLHNEVNDYLEKNYNDIEFSLGKQKRLIHLVIKLHDYLLKIVDNLNDHFKVSDYRNEKDIDDIGDAIQILITNPDNFSIEAIDIIYGTIHEIIRRYIWKENRRIYPFR